MNKRILLTTLAILATQPVFFTVSFANNTKAQDTCTKRLDTFLSGLSITIGVSPEITQEAQRRITKLNNQRLYQSDCEVYASIPEIKQNKAALAFALEELKKQETK